MFFLFVRIVNLNLFHFEPLFSNIVSSQMIYKLILFLVGFFLFVLKRSRLFAIPRTSGLQAGHKIKGRKASKITAPQNECRNQIWALLGQVYRSDSVIFYRSNELASSKLLATLESRLVFPWVGLGWSWRVLVDVMMCWFLVW